MDVEVFGFEATPCDEWRAIKALAFGAVAMAFPTNGACHIKGDLFAITTTVKSHLYFLLKYLISASSYAFPYAFY